MPGAGCIAERWGGRWAAGRGGGGGWQRDGVVDVGGHDRFLDVRWQCASHGVRHGECAIFSRLGRSPGEQRSRKECEMRRLRGYWMWPLAGAALVASAQPFLA